MRNKISILIISAMMILSYISTASAANWGVCAANNDNGQLKSACGTFGYNYVMANPNVTNLHVSSIYLRNTNCATPNMAETGWVKCPYRDINVPKFFSAWINNGTYNDVIWDTAPLNSNHCYKVLNVQGTNKWRFYIDGTQKIERTYSTTFRSGTSSCSSERDVSTDTNYSHFWSMRFMNASGTWNDWNNLYLFIDNDPNYGLVKSSNTSCYMQI